MKHKAQLLEAARAIMEGADLFREALSGAKQAKIIGTLQRRMAEVFKRQGKLLAPKLERLKPYFVEGSLREAAGDDILTMFEEVSGATRVQAEKALEACLFDGLTMSFVEQAQELHVAGSFKLPQPRAKEWARLNAAKRVAAIDDTTQQVIRDMVTKGIADGESYGTVAKKITTRFEEFAVGRPQEHIRSRAEMVAVTENAYAMEGGNRMLVDDMVATGLAMEKSRGGPDDERTSDACRADMDAGWIPEDQLFPSGISEGPEHPGCRHNTQYRVAREEE